ncbi:hypothetical protein BUALT_Bualt07G0066800 [Buddleja alternifolia]|uniref:NB-ARC domain-containing protein n=1 Tax=Buddleja alternifolia TaxID=168488 RepID=A0AAV6X8L5_9LAMI|nr:hypothetical protein BUALT_Bualt07G0066800 [Buddleja alternifolia]
MASDDETEYVNAGAHGTGKNVVVGFDCDLMEIKTHLAHDSPMLGAIPIVGMGGIGKTTLARQVFDDSYVVNQFDIRAWVTVGILTENMYESSEAKLVEYLYKGLNGRRYLMDSKGSRVILTTRLLHVALYANSCGPVHRMGFLSPDDSWNLLCNKVFGEEDCPHELEEIGKEIAQNCEGLPIAIVVISVFPEDHEIPVPKLIRLWIAEGFLEPHKSKSLEELAEEYLKDLIERNLILVRKRNFTGKIKTCNIHDLLKNLCILKAHEENFLYVVKGNYNALKEAEIIKLVYLRYLAFTYNDSLPSSIADLQNLETVVHHSWTYSKYPFLPVEIWTMPKLRHIYVAPSYLRDALDAQILVNNSFLLENLQTLLDERNLRCGSDILKRTPNLKELGISYDVSSSAVWSEYHLETLVNLLKLEKLKLLIKNLSHKPEIVHQSQLAFPQNLKRLTLIGCAIAWECMTIVGSLPNLQVLKLKRNACRGTEWKPLEDEFSQLRYLLLEDLDLVEWIAEDTHFPHLQRLTIRSCFKLKEIPYGFGEIPTLEMIELVNCHDSAVSSAQEIEKEQHDIGNKDLQVVVGSRR